MEIPLNESGKASISDELFQRVSKRAEESYRQRPQVICPYFKEGVHLNAKGYEHIKFKSWGKQRLRPDQYFRLKFLYLVPEIIAKSHTVQGIWETFEWERRKRHGVWEKLPKKVFYYEFVAVLEKVRLKVLVKEVEGGVKFFWSIIPFWKMNPVTRNRILHEGNPNID